MVGEAMPKPVVFILENEEIPVFYVERTFWLVLAHPCSRAEVSGSLGRCQSVIETHGPIDLPRRPVLVPFHAEEDQFFGFDPFRSLCGWR